MTQEAYDRLIRTRPFRCRSPLQTWLPAVLVGAMVFPAGCAGEDPVVVRGQLEAGSSTDRDSGVVELAYGGSDPSTCSPVPGENVRACSFTYEDELGPGGGFVLRASPTSEMEEEQERTGVVRFYVHAVYGEAEHCTRWEAFEARFVDGRWTAPDTEHPPPAISIDETSPGDCLEGESLY